MVKLKFDDLNLLSYELEEKSNLKLYSFCFSWWRFNSKDKGILIYNKRQWRIIHLKEISEGMQVCYLQKNMPSMYPQAISLNSIPTARWNIICTPLDLFWFTFFTISLSSLTPLITTGKRQRHLRKCEVWLLSQQPFSFYWEL